MKKFTMFLSAMMLAFLLVASPVMADSQFGSGAYFNIDASAIGGAIDADLQTIPNGIAGGISGAGGLSGAQASGAIWQGGTSGYVSAWGGGLTNTQAYVFNPGFGDVSIGVGSSSQSYGVTGAKADISISGQSGCTSAYVNGMAAQGTLNGSTLSESPIFFRNTTGVTGGVAGQGSIGSFQGNAWVSAGWYTSAEAGMTAEVDMNGSSYSNSYRFVDWNGSTVTEGMGTQVGAQTEVTSYGNDYREGNSYANVSGGWRAIGGAATKTVQSSPTGYASASAVGFYSGQGGLNTNFSGSANGYSATQITTFNGMNGSVIHSSAGMSVFSRVTPNCVD